MSEQLPTQWHDKSDGIFARLRRYGLTGLAVVAPAGLTVYILYTLVTLLDGWLIQIVPATWRPEYYLGYPIAGTGLVAGVLVILIIGMLTRNFVGTWLVKQAEGVIDNIPLVGSMYGAIKQIIDTVTASQTDAFRDVVLVEYPRKGMWALGFLTGRTKGQIQKITDDEVVNIFVPTTPNPTSGFLLFVPRKDITLLDMTVEQGIKMVVSGGIVTPTMAEGKAAVKAQNLEA